MSLLNSPEGSRRGAKVIQTVPSLEQSDFIKALSEVSLISEMREPYREWMRKGHYVGVSDSLEA